MRRLCLIVPLLVVVLASLQCGHEGTQPVSPQGETPDVGVLDHRNVDDFYSALVPEGQTLESVAGEAGDEDLIPLWVQKGDLIFCELKPWVVAGHPEWDLPGFDHVAIYTTLGWCIEATDFAVTPQVRKIPVSTLRLGAYLTFARVKNATSAQRNAAVDFARSQLGRPYQGTCYSCINHDPNDPTDPYSDWWYCSELAWACWYNQGIDIADVGPVPYEKIYIPPQRLYDDNDVE